MNMKEYDKQKAIKTADSDNHNKYIITNILLQISRNVNLYLMTVWDLLYVPPASEMRNSVFCPHNVYMCLCGSEKKKQQLFPYTVLTF